jgi:hypothetical protein
LSDLTINPFLTWKVSNYHSQEKLPRRQTLFLLGTNVTDLGAQTLRQALANCRAEKGDMRS